ncbi:MAG: UDP-N-acetylmuramoyl-tripeptide--D-alanyl-D-alanine ligase [Pedosphaera sp.]|nr:UDP-N-acetylmuramoyl-tripeptide--D-alanyl-D-alanine ligase [Pedosphaera sp.]
MKYVVEACGGELLNGSTETLVNRVCTDSRQAQPGDLFIALSGERFDAHDFLGEVAQKSVAAMVIEKSKTDRLAANAPRQSAIRNPQSAMPCAVITVDNTRQALGRLAARYRADFTLPVVAVGGSNGKTTTKELLASVLQQKFNTLWSEASFNNDIGVPVTLLKLEKTHQAAVLEVGTNHPGELAPLVRMIQPGLGVITSIGREHLEFFGDLAGVAAEEGWLAELLPMDGTLFLNGDSEWAGPIAKRTRAQVVRVGLNSGNGWRASDLQLDEQGMRFRVDGPKAGLSGEYRINLLGQHQVVNAVFAVAVGAELGMSQDEIQQGLAICKPAKMRLERWNWNGVCVLDDAYNANTDSMKAALQTLRQMPCTGRRVAVLGEMGEQGGQSQAAHEEVGRVAAEVSVAQLFAIGKMAGVMAGAARAAGLRDVSEFADPLAAVAAVKQFLKPGDVMLLKASRATRLERLAEALKSQDATRKV